MHPTTIISGYLCVQAAGTAAWWMLLVFVPSSIDYFQPSDWPNNALLGFWFADAVVLIGGSLACAYLIAKRHAWASPTIWALVAATWYPTLYCIGVSLMTNEAWIASSMMVSMAGLTLAMATIQGHANQQSATIRVTQMARSTAVIWTLIQTVIFWSTFLWIIPKGIVEAEPIFALPTLSHDLQKPLAAIVFLVASLLGIWTGITMATRGGGTPLPTATAPRLVIAGPYQWVRNPMAVAGIVQGLAVGWYLGSYVVIAYAIAGIFVWHIFVRPVEERDLADRFGESYLSYKRNVGLWVPGLTAWR